MIKARPQWVTSPSLGAPVVGEVVDLMSPRVRVMRDNLGHINRALERDLYSFKTGDMTVKLLNDDGFFDDLFAIFGPADTWGFRLGRRGADLFYGCIIGAGSVTFDRHERTVEIMVYGLNKLLDIADGSNVARPVQAGGNIQAGVSAGATSIIVNLVHLETGDVLHLTDHVNAEDVTVKLFNDVSGVATLEAPLAHSYAAFSSCTQTTLFYRYKSIAWLATQLFAEAGFALSDLRLSTRVFRELGPTPINLSGLGDLSKDARRGIAQVGGAFLATLDSDATYSQATPDAAWVKEGGAPNTKGWVDWSKYYLDGSPEPAVQLRGPLSDSGEGVNTTKMGQQASGYDFDSATKVAYGLECEAAPPGQLNKYTTADGVSWSAATLVANVPFPWANTEIRSCGCEFHPRLGGAAGSVIVWGRDLGSTTTFFRYRDLNSGTWIDMKQAGDAANTGYFGACYVPELDAVLVLKCTVTTASAPFEVGPAFTICAFRGAAKLWERAFPGCYVKNDNAARVPMFFPTRTLRYINGALYCVLVSDGAVQFLHTADQFASYTMNVVFPSTSNTRLLAARINGSYAIAGYSGAVPRGYCIAAPFYAGVIPYADFTGISAAEALKKLAVLANAYPFVDDAGGGHFVSRDLFDPGQVLDVTDRVSAREETLIWQDASQYVSLSGNGVEAIAGLKAFASQGIEISSDLLPNEAFAQQLATAVFGYYSARRKHGRFLLVDRDGRIYSPLDRIVVDGTRWFVSESDHDSISDTHDVQCLEDVA